MWVQKLDATNDSDTYFEFFDTFGTHFPTEVVYGARFTYQHKMSSQKYKKSVETGVNVAAQASYSGLFSAGGGFDLDAKQKQSVSEFRQNVETKTITVGAAPPANGDAMTWASQVETSPVPTAYQLTSIENLFTDTFMENLGVNYTVIKTNIEKYSREYCYRLKDQGELDDCDKPAPGILLENTHLVGHYKELAVHTLSECIESCLSEIYCKAITFCSECKSFDAGFEKCFMFKEEPIDQYKKTGEEGVKWKTSIFTEKINNKLIFYDTTIIGQERNLNIGNTTEENTSFCFERCLKDAHCIAFTFCDCQDKTHKCSFYSEKNLNALKRIDGSTTMFIPDRPPLTTSTTKLTPASTTPKN